MSRPVRLDGPVAGASTVVSSRPLAAALPQRLQARGFACHRIGPVDRWAGRSAGWAEAEAVRLGRRERACWSRLPPGRRREEWLLGRIAAKEATSAVLRAERGFAPSARDLEILADMRGAPVAHDSAGCSSLPMPAVSISHAGGVALAVAGRCTWSEGLGVDLEPVRPLAEDLLAVSFRAEERELVASLGPARLVEWHVRLWCAKEALGKALGLGLPTGPRGVMVRHLEPDTGEVEMTLAGRLRAADGPAGGAPARATTRRVDDLIVAIVVTRHRLVADK